MTSFPRDFLQDIQRDKFYYFLSCHASFLNYVGVMMEKYVINSMKTATSRVVTTLDISIIAAASTSGVLCGLFGLARTRKFNHILREVSVYPAHG